MAGPLVERFDKLIFSEDLQVQDLTAGLDEVGVHGPSAASVIDRATGIAAGRLQNQYDNITESGMTIVRDDSLGVTGFDLYVAPDESSRLRKALVEAGAVEASDATAETLRIEAGRPRFGMDMDTDTIPLEAGIEDRAISFTKGCYVGQEVIVRVLHRGHGRVARRLVGLALTAGSVPSRGDSIVAGDQPVGHITSATDSPSTGTPIAMGYVHRDHTGAGTELAVKSQGGTLSARVRDKAGN
jgi:folate-binding protein YgfZ